MAKGREKANLPEEQLAGSVDGVKKSLSITGHNDLLDKFSGNGMTVSIFFVKLHKNANLQV